MPREATGPAAPARGRDRRRRAPLPDPKAVEEEVQWHARRLFSSIASPATLLAGAHAASALRRMVELAASEGPTDPRFRESALEVERAVLTAIREAASTLLQELNAPRNAPLAPPAPQPLVEVSVERIASKPSDENAPAPSPPRRPRSRGGGGARRPRPRRSG